MLNFLVQQARFLDRNKLHTLSAGTRKRHDKRENIYEFANVPEYIECFNFNEYLSFLYKILAFGNSNFSFPVFPSDFCKNPFHCSIPS